MSRYFPHRSRRAAMLFWVVAASSLASSVPGHAAGAISTNPAALSFGGQVIATTSSQRPLEVTNTDVDPLTVIGVAITGSHAADFAVAVDPCSGATLAPGERCRLMLTFRPSATGARTAGLSFESSATTSPTVSLSGTGTQPTLTTSPSSVHLGYLRVGAPSPTVTVAITNTGSGVLGPIVATITGSNAGDVGITSNTCTASYGAGQGCSVGVRFTAGADGARTAALSLASNDPAGTRVVPLAASGDGTPPTTTFTTQDLSVVLGGGSFTGTIADTGSGVGDLTLTYRNVVGTPGALRIIPSCDEARTICSWSAAAPVVPGIYSVNASGTDIVLNHESPGPTITVVVL